MLFKDKNVLVVGGAGFVGSNLSRKILREGVSKLVVVDNLLSAEVENLPHDNRLQFILGSIADDRVLTQITSDYDYVFHLATYHGNQSSIANPLVDHQNNTLTTLKLCEHFKSASKLIKFVYSSAGCTVAKKTYEESSATSEDAEVSLFHDSPYQISKIIGEFYGNYYWARYKLPFVKARFQNVYGPSEVLGAGQWRGTPATVWRNVVPTFIWMALHKEPLPIENNGIASRDFIYVDDIVDGLIACALKGKEGEVYNLASGVETTIKELAVLINKLCDNPHAISCLPARPWDRSGKRFGSTEKSEKELSFKAHHTLEDGLWETIKWTRESLNWIKSVMLKHTYFLPELEKYYSRAQNAA